MSWFVEGNGENLGLGFSKYGNFSIWGHAYRHQPNTHLTPLIDERIESVEEARCHWSIYSSLAEEVEIDSYFSGFYELVRKNPDNSTAFIDFSSDGEFREEVNIRICVPPDTLLMAKDLFESVLKYPELSYAIGLDLGGPFDQKMLKDLPEDPKRWPSFEEFVDGSKGYFSEGVELSVRRKVLTSNMIA